MGALTEIEIFDCLTENFRLAAECCDDLARLPKKGPTYLQLITCLKLLEGACRQAGYWRDDSRFFVIGENMAKTHRQAGEWLRGVRQPDGSRRPVPLGKLHPLFLLLASSMRKLHEGVERLRHRPTGTLGPILPPQHQRDRVTRGVKYVNRGGVFVPASA